jgi:hypothetical protein
MMHRRCGVFAIAIVMIAAGRFAISAWAQGAQPSVPITSKTAPQDDARRRIVESERWQRTHRAMDEWLSIQQVYRPEQVASIRAELAARIAKMSSQELEDHLKVMEQQLQVLLSPEAEDAREWLGQFLAVARNPEQQLGRSLPNVLNMTAGEIRQELRWLEQHRTARQRSQAAFNQTRATQVQQARNLHVARQPATQPSDRPPARIANRPAYLSQYSPQRELRPAPMGPLYKIGPWGTPIYWHPQNPWW